MQINTSCILSNIVQLQVVPKELWSTKLWTMICTCIVQPAGVGFNLGDVEVMKNLPNEVCWYMYSRCIIIIYMHGQSLKFIDCFLCHLVFLTSKKTLQNTVIVD